MTLLEKFKTVFQEEATDSYFAPGRINLIGEHTDYNGGHVFPASITIGTFGAVRKRQDRTLRLYSENFAELGIFTIDLDDLAYRKEDNWTNYPKGVIKEFLAHGHTISSGLDIYFLGTIPNGAGLSSSASIELLTGIILEDQFDLTIDRVDIVKIGKLVENNYIGVNSGIMDQFAIGMGKKEHAILLDTNTLTYDLVPAKFGKYVIVIMNTNKRRELADSKYNERRSECEEALSRLQTVVDVQSLGELDEATFEANKHAIKDAILEKRARHAVTENQRTLLAREALSKDDLVRFGQLLNASHQSLKEDYEVTGIELDTLVKVAQEQDGVLGARMTGAGFGGCAIALVEEEKVDAFKAAVGSSYEKEIGYAADFYIASIADGAKKLS